MSPPDAPLPADESTPPVPGEHASSSASDPAEGSPEESGGPVGGGQSGPRIEEVAAPVAVEAASAVAIGLPPTAAARDPDEALRAALAALPERSSDPLVCPFLRSFAPPGELRQPLERASSGNRCVSAGEPFAQGDLQQQLLCLVPGHVACPRYERGVAAVRAGLLTAGAGRRDRPALAVRLAGIALIGAIVLAAGFALLNGGLGGPAATPTAVAQATVTASPTVVPTPSPAPTSSPVPTPTAPPSASPTPPLTATPSPTHTAAPTGIAARWAGLPHCPSPQTCYIYTVRKGDTFFGIATYYGTNVAGLKKLNPQYATNTTIHVGDKIKVPPPPG